MVFVLIRLMYYCTWGLFCAPARLYEAETCYEDVLEHAEHNLEMAYLARFLQAKVSSCKNLAR